MKKERTGAVTKYLILVFGAFAIFFTGYPHIWSIYQPYAMELTGWSQGQTSMCFYLSFVTFVLGNIVGGRIQDKTKSKDCNRIGRCNFYSQYFVKCTGTETITGHDVYHVWIVTGIWTGNDLYNHSFYRHRNGFPGRTDFHRA